MERHILSKRHLVTLGMALGVVLLLLAACGGSDPTATPVPSTATATPVAALAPGTGPAPSKVKGSIVNFILPNLTVPVGTTVVWTNEDFLQHTTTSGTNGQFDGLGWNSPFLSKDETFSHTFNQKGTFSYTCRVHPALRGTVTVVASGEPVVGPGSPGSGDTGLGAEYQ